MMPSGNLHLVPSPAERLPTKWSPAPLLSHYGVDYTFLRLAGRRPVSWARPVVVRLHGTAPVSLEQLESVVAELADLTGLELRATSSTATDPARTEPPLGEIEVGQIDRSSGALRPLCGCEWPGSGAAIPGADGSGYRRGYALLDGDLVEKSGQSLMSALRHQLGHALGLGHANRASELMCARPGLGVVWGPGDRTGLRLLGRQKPPIETE